MTSLSLIAKQSIGPFKLGSTREEIRAAASTQGYSLHSDEETIDRFFNNAIMIEYDEGTASYIEIYSDPDIELIYEKLDLFGIPAEQAFSVINTNESTPASYTATEHLATDQVIALTQAEAQYDYKNGKKTPVWGQIGIGDQRYLDFINMLNSTDL